MGMSLSTADLPRDPDDLRRVAGDLQRDVVTLSAEIYAKTLLIEKLKMQLAVLRRARFGRSSERLDQAVEQIEPLIGGIRERENEKERDVCPPFAKAESPAVGPRALARSFAARSGHPRARLGLSGLRRREVRQDRHGQTRGA